MRWPARNLATSSGHVPDAGIDLSEVASAGLRVDQHRAAFDAGATVPGGWQVASSTQNCGSAIRTVDRYAAALAGLPPPWWLHTDLDVLATGELAAVDYPQPGGLTWGQLAGLTATALATDGCAGWSVCIYNPDLDPGRDGADAIISYITQAITVSDQPAR